jgi:hypothetical protein
MGQELMEQPITGIYVELEYEPQAFFYSFCTPIIEIDGKPYRRRWGTHFLEVEPGKHTVRIFFKYFFWRECGANSIEVVINRGDIARIAYYKTSVAFAPGHIDWQPIVLSHSQLRQLRFPGQYPELRSNG